MKPEAVRLRAVKTAKEAVRALEGEIKALEKVIDARPEWGGELSWYVIQFETARYALMSVVWGGCDEDKREDCARSCD